MIHFLPLRLPPLPSSSLAPLAHLDKGEEVDPLINLVSPFDPLTKFEHALEHLEMILQKMDFTLSRTSQVTTKKIIIILSTTKKKKKYRLMSLNKFSIFDFYKLSYLFYSFSHPVFQGFNFYQGLLILTNPINKCVKYCKQRETHGQVVCN